METSGFLLKCPRCDSTRMSTGHKVKCGKYKKLSYKCAGCGYRTLRPVPIYAMVEESNLSATIEVFSPLVSEKRKPAYVPKRRNVVISLPDSARTPYSEALGTHTNLRYAPLVETKVLGIEVIPQASFWRLIACFARKIWNWIMGRIK